MMFTVIVKDLEIDDMMPEYPSADNDAANLIVLLLSDAGLTSAEVKRVA